MGVVKDAIDAAFADGPSAKPDEVKKASVRRAGVVIESAIVGASAGAKRATTIAGLGVGDRAAQPGQVTSGADKGEYTWDGDEWIRTGDLIDPLALQADIADKADQTSLDGEIDDRLALIGPDQANAADPEAPAFPFQDAEGFYDFFVTLGGMVRSAKNRLDLQGSVFVKDDYTGWAITDDAGFVFLAADPTGIYLAGQSAEPSSALDFTPYFAPVLCGAKGVPVSLSMAGLISNRANATRCQMTLLGASGHQQSADDMLTVVPGDLGATAELVLRKRDDAGSQRATLPLLVKSAPVPAVSPSPFNILMIGDSIINRQAGYLLKTFLESWGYQPNFIGTMLGNGSADSSTPPGPLGEGREGWESGDYTYAITDRAIPIAPGGEAAYLALPKLDQRDRNPFIRAATGSDPTSIIRNGYVLDFAYYQSRFSLQTPAIVLYEIGTNNVRDREESEIYNTILDDDKLLLSRVRAAWPNAKILRTLPGTARDLERDPLWAAEYIPLIKGMMDALKSVGDSKMQLVPAWAMASPDGGYALTSSTPDPTTGVIASGLSDNIHPIGPTRAALFRAIAGYVACAAAGLI